MECDGIVEILKIIIEEQLGVDGETLTEETKFVDDLSANSQDIVELVMKLEEVFDFEIPDEDIEKITTVGDIIKHLKNN